MNKKSRVKHLLKHHTPYTWNKKYFHLSDNWELDAIQYSMSSIIERFIKETVIPEILENKLCHK